MRTLSLPQERLKLKKTPKLTLKIILLATILTMTASIGLAPIAAADTYENQIRNLRQQNSQAVASQRALQATEESLAARVSSLQASIVELETRIGQQQARADVIAKRLVELEAEISDQRIVLGSSIREIYMDEQVTTLEKVAMSKDWSEYADKEQYNLSIKDKIKQTLDQIKILKSEQEAKKAEADRILNEQKARQTQLAADRAEAARLLSLNLAQQAEYNQTISANNSKIAQLRSAQAALNARSFVGGVRYSGSGGYPWANAPFPNSIADPWGMYKRQCVSYTAWKVASSGRHMPYWGGHGDAKLWDDNARSAGIPVDTTPRVGDVAVSNSGTYGHVMYVEAVHGDGTISISQYNAGWDGRYSEGRRSSAGLYFIHF